NAAGSDGDVRQVVRCRDHDEDDVAHAQVDHRIDGHRAACDERVELAPGAVPDPQRHAGIHQSTRHRRTHPAGTEPTDRLPGPADRRCLAHPRSFAAHDVTLTTLGATAKMLSGMANVVPAGKQTSRGTLTVRRSIRVTEAPTGQPSTGLPDDRTAVV